jgi:hypothetical protein
MIRKLKPNSSSVRKNGSFVVTTKVVGSSAFTSAIGPSDAIARAAFTFGSDIICQEKTTSALVTSAGVPSGRPLCQRTPFRSFHV